jgi:hypothetical protein
MGIEKRSAGTYQTFTAINNPYQKSEKAAWLGHVGLVGAFSLFWRKASE